MSFGSGECKVCDKSYERVSLFQMFCSRECREEHKRQENIRKWVEKKPREPANLDLGSRLDGRVICNGATRSSKRFSVCKG